VKYAYVITNLLDLWKEPRFNSERLSQLLFGEVIRVGSARSGYVRITQTDGYAGWVDGRFLKSVSRTAALEYQRSRHHVVAREQARLLDWSPDTSPTPHFLYYGTHVRVRTCREGVATCRLPDGGTLKLRRNHLRPIKKISVDKVSGTDLVREARRFLGAPYLWGGLSPAGFDCSGLVRTILGSFGLYVPRDTKDQIKAGTPVLRDAVKTGDLIFFRRHVGLAIGRNRIIHSSVGGSGVRINSLVPGMKDYRADLDRDYAAARRIL